jgi:hypothetical protein
MGYAFPYDDVKPDFNSEVSGTISGDHPSALRIYVGGRDLGVGQQSSACCSSGSSSPSSSSASSSSSPSPTASTMSTEVVQSPSATVSSVDECAEGPICTPNDLSVYATTTTIGVTVTVGEIPPPDTATMIIGPVDEFVTVVETATVTSIVMETIVVEESGY